MKIVSIILIALVLILVVIGSIFVFQNQNSSSNSDGIKTVNNVPENSGNNQNNEGSADGVMTASPKTYNIDIQNFAYKTKTLTIKKGDIVIWTNRDSVRHTVTSDSGNELDSELLSQSGSYSHTFAQTGTYDYHCKPHPYMTGTIIVE